MIASAFGREAGCHYASAWSRGQTGVRVSGRALGVGMGRLARWSVSAPSRVHALLLARRVVVVMSSGDELVKPTRRVHNPRCLPVSASRRCGDLVCVPTLLPASPHCRRPCREPDVQTPSTLSLSLAPDTAAGADGRGVPWRRLNTFEQGDRVSIAARTAPRRWFCPATEPLEEGRRKAGTFSRYLLSITFSAIDGTY